MSKKRVLLLFGGRSAEREVSLESAKTVAAGLDPKRYETLLVHIDPEGRWNLQPGRVPSPAAGTSVLAGPEPALYPQAGGAAIPFDVAFPILHGPYGEDGTVQGVLELARAPYVGSGVLGSSVGMDKPFSKRLAQAAGLKVPGDIVVRAGEPLQGALTRARRLGLPLYVKPASLGSSVGVRRVAEWKDLGAAVKEALRFDVKAVIEQGVEGTEVAVAVLGDESGARSTAPAAILPSKKHGFYTYEAKYVDPEGYSLQIPAKLPAAKIRELKARAEQVFLALEACGPARVDFLLDRKHDVYFGEINTLPGFTSHSLYPKLWAAEGLPLPRLLDELIALAFKRAQRKAALQSKP